MKAELEALVRSALDALQGNALNAPVDPAAVVVERVRDAQHGDFSCNVAMRLAKVAGKPPRELATQIVAHLPASALVAKAEIAGAGFINFFLRSDTHGAVLRAVLEQGERYGTNQSGAGQSILLEFVSANPTGPLHVGHGRQAAYGATLANLLAACGHAVHREYYINDAGRQVDILTVSVWVRYLEACGEVLPFPENGYRGDYVRDVAARLLAAEGATLRQSAAQVQADLPADAPAGDKEKYIDALIGRMRTLLGAAAYERVLQFSLQVMLEGIRLELAAFGVEFEQWFSERALSGSGRIEQAMQLLRAGDHLYEKEGATWFRSTRFGDDEDRVLVRANGQYTYFAPDLAYHLDKRARGFAKLIDIWGADHHGYIPRMRGGLMALGASADALEVCLMQFVSLFRGGEKIPMGKREGQFVTLTQLREEVGSDACRLFYLMRSQDQPLDFDLELAKSRSNENPVYYIQYAHARVASVMKQLAARGLSYDSASALANLPVLSGAPEQALLTALARYPEVVLAAARARAPHQLVHFLRDLASSFHNWYNGSQFLVEDAGVRNARLALALGAQQVLKNGLTLLGVSAPDSM
ncbi:MAG: arginine--tRNA ligase [Steroidobacteraceae bacterium]